MPSPAYELLEDSGHLNVIPADGGLPSAGVRPSTDVRALVLSVRSIGDRAETQHLIHLEDG